MTIAMRTTTRRINLRFRELTTVRTHWYLAAAGVLLPVLIVTLRVLLPNEDPAVEFATASDRLGLLTTPINGLWLYAAVGALTTGSTWRHGEISRMLLHEPRRPRLLASQVLAATMAVTVVATASVLVLVPVTSQALQYRDAQVGYGAGAWGVAVGTIVACAIFGAIGAALAATTRNTPTATVAIAAGLPLIDFAVGLMGSSAIDMVSPVRAVEKVAGEDGMDALQPSGFGTILIWLAMTVAVALWSTSKDVR